MSTVKITDAAGNKPVFTQWDVDRILYISGVDSQPCMHFANAELNRALVVEAEQKNDRWTCRVPNFMLQFAGQMLISVFVQPDEGVTVAQLHVHVRPKLKPQDYTYTENIGYINWVQKTEEVHAFMDSLDLRLVSGAVNVRSKVPGGELTSENIAQAIHDALADGSIIYIPAGHYTFNTTITQDCTILMDDKCYISTAIQAPCISASNCSISIYGGNAYIGEDDGDRHYIGWPAVESLRGYSSIIRLGNCHDCVIRGVKFPHHKSLYAVFAANCKNLIIESCSFDKILNCGVYLDRHCEKVTIRNCFFQNARYAINRNGEALYYCYFVCTGGPSGQDAEIFEPVDGLIIENCYCYNSEDSGIDTHGARNVIMRNNTVLETVCALTAYNDNRRIKRPSGWCMENIVISNNYCRSSKSNNPLTQYPHPFIFLGASNGYSATDEGYSDNPGSYDAYCNCIVQNNTFITATTDTAISLNEVAQNVVIENNVIDAPNAAWVIAATRSALGVRIKGNDLRSGLGIAIPSGSSVEIDYGVIDADYTNRIREIRWTGGLGVHRGQIRGTVVSCGDDIMPDANHLVRAVGFGKRVTSAYTGTRSFSVTVADGVCTQGKHRLIPGMRVSFTAQGSTTAQNKFVERLVDFDRFTLNSALADGTYTMVLSETSYYDAIPSDSAPAMDGTAAAGSSDSYARADHVHPTDTSRLAANQGAANAGKILGIGNDGIVAPVAAPSGGSEWTSLYDADLTEDIAAIAFSDLDAKEIAVFFDGRVNLSDDSAANATATVVISINGTKVQQGAYCYVRGSGSKTQTIFRYEVIGGKTFGYANAYQNGSGAGTFAAQGGKKDAQSIESIRISPVTSGHLFKSGGHLTAMWR